MHPSTTRRAARWAGATAAVAGPAVAGVTWAAARALTDSPTPRVRQPTLRARFLDGHRVELVGDRAADQGTWGVQFDGGFVRVDHPLVHDERRATRPYRVLEGEAPTPAVQQDRRRSADRRHGDRGFSRERRLRRDRRQEQLPPPWPVRATITPFAWPDDPQVLAHHTGAQLRLDGVRSGGHTLPTWMLLPPDHSATWVVGVHGRGSPRTELFRLAEVALRLGHPVLVASYRTDVWTGSPTPTTTLGTVEWRDVEANVAAALAHGARRVVLAGCSLGGSLVAATVRRSRLTPWVGGVVLDSPALQWGGLLRHVASSRGLPTVLVPPVMAAARLRARVDWSALDHLAAVDEFSQPVLLLHGEQDDVVPVWLSEAFAAARPELATLVTFPDADHVTSWNHDPLRYEREVRRFLTRVATA